MFPGRFLDLFVSFYSLPASVRVAEPAETASKEVQATIAQRTRAKREASDRPNRVHSSEASERPNRDFFAFTGRRPGASKASDRPYRERSKRSTPPHVSEAKRENLTGRVPSSQQK